ncbi:MAG: alpha/beta hydrolase [Chloroflexi bacterium]|nr:alpha/beta hydrolase [Chloroflexota bacterium]
MIAERTIMTSHGPVRLLSTGPVDRPALLLVHGYAATADQWRPLMMRLRDRYHLLAFDLLGFGAAPMPAPPYTVERWLEQVNDLLAIAGDQVTLVGHSLGGLIAAEAGRRWPTRTHALGLICPFGVLPPLFAFGTRGPGRHLMAPLRQPAVGTTLFRWLRLTQGVLAWPMAISAFHQPFGAPADVTEQFRWLINQPRAELALLDVIWRLEELETGLTPGEITEPALLIWGKQDRLLPASLLRDWQARLPQADVLMIDRCGHLPHVERVDAVAAALDRLATRAPMPAGAQAARGDGA